MKLKISQFDTEAHLYKILDFGDETRIAEKLGCSSSIISQMCNPDDERKSDFYKAAKFIAALCEISPERGRKMLDLFTRTVEKHLPAKPSTYEKSVKSFNRELNEFLDAQMLGKSADVRQSELDDVIEAAVQLKKTIRAESQFPTYRPAVNGAKV